MAEDEIKNEEINRESQEAVAYTFVGYGAC